MKQKQVLKASTAAILAFSALQPVMSVEASQTITDVKKSSKYYEGVKFLSANKAFQGSKYYPEKNLTQEAAVQMLSKVWKVKAAKAQKGVFTNVPKTSKLFPVLHGMVARGILEKSKTFDGKKLIKRSELLVWSQRAFRLTPTAVQPYQDVSLSSDTGKAASALNAFDFLSDIYPDTKLHPEKVVKRGELAQWSHLLSKRQPVTMSVERTTDRTVVINGLTYTFDQKWKKLFQSSAIKKANIVFTADKGKIKSIEQITIQQGGKSSAPYILDGGDVQLPRLIVKTNYVKVQNLKIKQLDVLEQAKKGVTFEHVDVTGKVQVQSSPSAKKQQLASPVVKGKASIMSQSTSQRRTVENVEVIKSYDGARVLFIDSDVEELIVTHPNTSVIVSKGATIKKVVLSANARIETNQGAVIEQLLVKRGTLYAEVAGTIQNCQVEAPVELEIVKDAVIQNLSTAEEATIQGAGKIDQMQIKDGSKSLELNVSVRQMEVLTSQSIELLGKPNIGSLKIGEQATSVSLKIESNIPEVVIASKTVKMDVGTGVQITSLQIPSGSNASDLITNYDKVEDQIKNPPVVTPPTGGTTPSTPPTGETTPSTPPTGGTTPSTPPTGETTPSTPPTTKTSKELDQVLAMKGDQYAVFDLTEELLEKLVESKEIDTFDSERINDYRLYIKSMTEESFKSSEDLKRVLDKVEEINELSVLENQEYILTPSSINENGVAEEYQLSIKKDTAIRTYYKKSGKLIRVEDLKNEGDFVRLGYLEKVEGKYQIYSYDFYDEIIFEYKDKSYRHFEINDGVRSDYKILFTQLNGMDIKLPTQEYDTKQIKKVNENDSDYKFYKDMDFEHFVYYELPNVNDFVEFKYDGRKIANEHRYFFDGEDEHIIVGIAKSLHQDGKLNSKLLIPNYLPTSFVSEIDVNKIDKKQPYQFIIERYEREEYLDSVGISLNDQLESHGLELPISLETFEGKALVMDNVEILASTPADEEIATVEFKNQKLSIIAKKAGDATFKVKVGEFQQELRIHVSESKQTIDVSKVKTKEDALEVIRRSMLLNDINSLSIELFQKISTDYSEEGLNIYRSRLFSILHEEMQKPEDLSKTIESFVESNKLLNERLRQLREATDEDISPLIFSLRKSETTTAITRKTESSNLLIKRPNDELESRDWLQFEVEKIEEKYFVDSYYGINKNSTYTYYQFNDETGKIERGSIEFGSANDLKIEILKINDMSIMQFMEQNSSTKEETNGEGDISGDVGTDTPTEETPSSTEGENSTENGETGDLGNAATSPKEPVIEGFGE